ncbi:MAG: ankyrin repeat domain-containing protein, partial [Gammaproteobacteria bacterium]|nr:ankyrin repeat domain-containing protein [Gammaproteobacteria bacterium]
NTFRATLSTIPISNEASKWEEIKDDPAMKNALLLESLAKFCDMKTSKVEKVKEILEIMQKNIALMSPDLGEQKIMLAKLLNTPTTYNSKWVLHNAINNNHSEIIMYLIPFLEENSIEDILCYAIKNNDINTVELLEEKLQNSSKVQDAILEAAKNGHINMVDMLNKKNINIERKDGQDDILTNGLSLGLIELAKKEDYYTLKKVICEHKELDLNILNQEGETLESILLASFNGYIKEGNTNKLSKFKDIFPDFFEKFILATNEKEEKNGLQYSAIYSVVTQGNLKMLEFLSSNSSTKFNISDKSFIIEECLKFHIINLLQNSNYEDVSEILNKNNIAIDSSTISGDKIHSFLLYKFREEINDGNLLKLKEFKNNFPQVYNDFLNTPDIKGDTALAIAVSKNHYDIVNYLLDEKTIDKEMKNNENLTPLLCAALKGNLNIINLLLKNGADEKVMNDDKGLMYYINLGIIELAKNNKLDEIVEIIKIYPQLDLTKINNTGESVENIIMLNSNPTLQELTQIKNMPVIFNQFLKLGSNKSQVELAIYNESDIEKLKFLIENKADLSIKNSDNESLLMMAANYGNIEAVKVLLKTELFDMNEKSLIGSSVLDVLFEKSLGSLDKLINFMNSFPQFDKLNKDEIRYPDFLALKIISKVNIDLNALKEIKNMFPDVNFNFEDNHGDSVNSTLLRKFYDNVLTHNLKELREFKKLFPEMCYDFVNKSCTPMGQTALMVYISNPNPKMELLKFLLENKPNLSINDELGYTVMTEAVANDCFEGIKLLRQAGDSEDITRHLFLKIKDYIRLDKHEKLDEMQEHLPDIFQKMIAFAAKDSDFYTLSRLLKKMEVIPEDKSIIENIDKCKQLMQFEEKDARSKRFSVLNTLYKTSFDEFNEALDQFISLDKFIQKLNTIPDLRLFEASQLAYEKCAENPKQTKSIMENLIKTGYEVSNHMSPIWQRFFNKKTQLQQHLDTLLVEGENVMQRMATSSFKNLNR